MSENNGRQRKERTKRGGKRDEACKEEVKMQIYDVSEKTMPKKPESLKSSTKLNTVIIYRAISGGTETSALLLRFRVFKFHKDSETVKKSVLLGNKSKCIKSSCLSSMSYDSHRERSNNYLLTSIGFCNNSQGISQQSLQLSKVKLQTKLQHNVQKPTPKKNQGGNLIRSQEMFWHRMQTCDLANHPVPESLLRLLKPILKDKRNLPRLNRNILTVDTNSFTYRNTNQALTVTGF